MFHDHKETLYIIYGINYIKHIQTLIAHQFSKQGNLLAKKGQYHANRPVDLGHGRSFLGQRINLRQRRVAKHKRQASHMGVSIQ